MPCLYYLSPTSQSGTPGGFLQKNINLLLVTIPLRSTAAAATVRWLSSFAHKNNEAKYSSSAAALVFCWAAAAAETAAKRRQWIHPDGGGKENQGAKNGASSSSSSSAMAYHPPWGITEVIYKGSGTGRNMAQVCQQFLLGILKRYSNFGELFTAFVRIFSDDSFSHCRHWLLVQCTRNRMRRWRWSSREVEASGIIMYARLCANYIYIGHVFQFGQWIMRCPAIELNPAWCYSVLRLLLIFWLFFILDKANVGSVWVRIKMFLRYQVELE